MPANLQNFIWLLGLGIIGLLITIVGILIKDKLATIIIKMEELHSDVVELFKEDKAKVKAIEEVKGDIKAINERCKYNKFKCSEGE